MSDDVKVPMLAKLLGDVLLERRAQDAKWGEQNHPPEKWLVILAEEFGEASRNLCDATFAKTDENKRKQLRLAATELIQTAAVCLAMVESFERNELKEER